MTHEPANRYPHDFRPWLAYSNPLTRLSKNLAGYRYGWDAVGRQSTY